MNEHRFTAAQKFEAANREVTQRVRVYARLIAKGAMTREKAEYETNIMRAIAADYHALSLKERLV